MVLRTKTAALVVLVSLSLVATACGGEAASTTEADEDTPSETTVAVESVEETEPAAEPDEVEDVEGDGDSVEAIIAEDEPITEPDPAADRDALVAEIEGVLLEWQTNAGIPGVSLSVRLPDQEPINIAAGVADLATQEPVTVDDYFRIASITKPMTATVILQLVDEGLVELDEPVETYLPGWLDGYPHAQEITIRQLMDHTNGLVEYALSPEFYALAGQRSDVAITTSEIREWLAEQEPLFAPGAEYSYETGGFLTLGDVIEAVTGNSAAAEMRTRIFEPAGAEHIYLTPEEFPPESVVNAYGRAEMYIAGTLLIGREDTDQLTIKDEAVIDLLGQPQDVLQSAGWTGGGNEARIESVSAIFAAIFDGTILTPDQIEAMTTPVLDTTYGLGIDSSEIDGVRVYSHGGGVPGFRSQANYLPDFDVSWVVSGNLIPLPEGAGVNELRAALQPLLVEAVS